MKPLFSYIIVALLLVSEVLGGKYPDAQYHSVDQDHFDGANSNTWQQAYYVNDTYWVPGSSAPIFLCVGGEGPPFDGSVVVDSVHCSDAVEFLEQNNALMFAVQHRYYNCFRNMSSCPVDTFAQQDALRFLSSSQALSDLVQFHAFATKQYNLTQANRWVTWGGSYPGMLSGWARIKFPQLFFASVASSAPVVASVEMQGYNDVVAFAYTVSDNNVGGSQACSDAIRVGHATIGTMLNTVDGRDTLASMFDLKSGDWLANPDNARAFCGEGVAEFPSQENDPSCTTPSCSIGKICQVMIDTTIGDEVTRLATVASQQKKRNEKSHWQIKLDEIEDMKKSIKSLKTNMMIDNVGVYDMPALWWYQTCTEFGFYQTCEIGTNCFFTQGLATLEYMIDHCSEWFDISSDKVADNVAYTNQYYGADKPSGSRVYYVNGEVDPWQANSILKSPSSGIPTLMVPGASHHAWTHPTLSTDQQSVIDARKTIYKQVSTWLLLPTSME